MRMHQGWVWRGAWVKGPSAGAVHTSASRGLCLPGSGFAGTGNASAHLGPLLASACLAAGPLLVVVAAAICRQDSGGRPHLQGGAAPGPCPLQPGFWAREARRGWLACWPGGGGGDRHGPSLLTPPAGCARPFPLPPGPERGPLLGAVVPGRPPAPVKKGRGWACRACGSRSGHPGHVCSRPGPSVCLRHMSALSPRHLAHPLTRGTHPSICGTQIRAFILSSAVVEGGPIFQGLCPERTPAPPRKGCWTDASQACALGPWRPGRVKACSVQTVHAAQQARGPQRWGELHPQVAASTCPAEMWERGEASASVRPEPGLRAPLTAGRTLRAQPARRRGPCGQTCQQAGGSPAGGAPLCEENWGTGLALWGRHRRRPLSQAEPQSLN